MLLPQLDIEYTQNKGEIDKFEQIIMNLLTFNLSLTDKMARANMSTQSKYPNSHLNSSELRRGQSTSGSNAF